MQTHTRTPVQPGRPARTAAALTWHMIGELVAGISGALDHAAFDVVVGVHRGGIIPATLLAVEMGLPVETFRVDYRRDPGITSLPENISPPRSVPYGVAGRRVLLVEDITVSGTLAQVAERWLRDPQGGAASAVATCALVVAGEYRPDVAGAVFQLPPSTPWARVR